MTPRPTPEQRAAAEELLAAVAARLGGTITGAYLDVPGCCVAHVAEDRVCVRGVAGFDGHTVIEAIPHAYRTPNGKPSQVWEIVGLIADRMAERIRRAPEMEALAAESAKRSGPTREPGDKVYNDGSEVPCV